MLKYKVRKDNLEAEVSINAEWTESAFVRYSGDDKLVNYLQDRVPSFFSYYGHRLGDEAVTPYDLHSALMNNTHLFSEVRLLEGIVRNNSPKVLPSDAPKDAVT